MSNDEKILATLEQIRDIQAKLLAKYQDVAEVQKHVVANQEHSLQTQLQTARLYKIALVICLGVVAYLLFRFSR